MKSWTSKWTIISTLALSMAAFAACGGDGGEDVGDGESASNEGEGEVEDDGGETNSSNNNNASAECGPASINQDDACEVCIGTKCTAEALACCEKEGCLDVVFCAAANECNGIDCYAPDKCQAEIDAAGLEVATTYAQPLGDCALTECATECESKVGDGS